MKSENEQPSRMKKWLGFTQRLHSTLELEGVVQTILDVALELTGMQRGFIMRMDTSGSPEFCGGRSSNDEPLQASDFTKSQSFVEKAALENTPQYSISDQGSVFCVPLHSFRKTVDSDSMVGILYAESKKKIDFGDDEKELLNVIATHAGPALENVLLYDLATRDPLTHLYHRQYFDSVGMVEWKRTLRHKRPLSVLMIDVDEFRAFNQEFGREEGDQILRKTSGILKSVCRAESVLCRYMEDKFALLLPETDAIGARHVGIRILEEARTMKRKDSGSPLTVSIGIATYPRCTVSNLQELIQLAEVALDQAKQAGKNRAIAYEPSLSKIHTKLF